MGVGGGNGSEKCSKSLETEHNSDLLEHKQHFSPKSGRKIGLLTGHLCQRKCLAQPQGRGYYAQIEATRRFKKIFMHIVISRNI